ncbi:phosphotransferase [Streptomyces sp. NPDC058667]|uniref:phosphotransferase n=1 Tax=Streptomyces sp. NPDC058667 TaxID=3346588 RepID=UPI00365BAFA0
MTTRTWDDLPPTLRRRITDQLAATGPAEPVAGGFTPGVRVQMPQDNGRAAFVKAIPAGDPLAGMYRTEAAINRTLPPGPRPRLLAELDEHDWVVLAFEHIEGRHPDLAPGSPDLPLVLDAVAALHPPLTPNPYPNAPQFTGHPVVAQAADHHEAMRGDTLLHCDIRSDNLLIGDHGVHFVDWALAHRGAPWLDVALLVPQLILAGHTPENAEKHASQVPAYRDAPDNAITAFASSITTYWVQRAGQGVPELRRYRKRALRAGRAWEAYRRR